MSTNIVKANAKRGAKSPAQVRCIFALAKQRGLSDDELHAVVEEATGQRSIAALSRQTAERVIVRLGGSQPVACRRTTQYRRQRTGVVQLATPAHLDLMHSLARRRNLSAEGLTALSTRIVKHYPPRTTVETNKVIEALRAMNARDGL